MFLVASISGLWLYHSQIQSKGLSSCLFSSFSMLLSVRGTLDVTKAYIQGSIFLSESFHNFPFSAQGSAVVSHSALFLGICKSLRSPSRST